MSPGHRIDIAGRSVGDGRPCLIIAEIGLSHEGSLGAAHAMIDAAADAGADAVKFQTHMAEHEGTSLERFRVKVFPQDATRGDYWRRTAFDEGQWRSLKEHAEARGLVFTSSPFSHQAVDLLARIGITCWKIASGETGNLPLMERVMETGLPVLLSSGMSPYREVESAVAALKARSIPLVLFQCTNVYPCPPERLGLNVLAEYRARFGVPVGLSDHSGKVWTGIAARTLGACSLEVHVTWHRKCFGPDVSSSLTFEELAELVQGVRGLERALASPVDKDREAESLSEIRALFTKSIVAAAGLPEGRRLTLGDLAFKKPGNGIAASEYAALVGKTLRKNLEKDEVLRWEDVE